MIQIQDVSFEYEKEQGTLSHIDLNIQQGECVVLTGEALEVCDDDNLALALNLAFPAHCEWVSFSD